MSLLWGLTTDSYETTKTHSDFYLNFFAAETRTKEKGVWQIKNLGEA